MIILWMLAGLGAFVLIAALKGAWCSRVLVRRYQLTSHQAATISIVKLYVMGQTNTVLPPEMADLILESVKGQTPQ